MIKDLETSLRPAEAASPLLLKKHVCKKLGLAMDEITHIDVLRRSIDARRHPVWIRLKVKVYTHHDQPLPLTLSFPFRVVTHAPRVIIAGTGPAGLFAALKLIEGGMKPVLLDRGKPVSERKHDIARINREHKVNPDSNYCFGEGGAGTFSDGKLYTRSTKRGNVRRILELMVFHGASPDILIDAHPHIGSDKLLPMITAIRKTILDCGGEFHFGHRVVEIETRDGNVIALVDQDGNRFQGEAFILATGHSARDIYQLFYSHGWALEAKSFAMGVRVEHPQSLINTIQYHAKNPDPNLPAASYSLVAQSEGRGVFSFCMCPGGIIVPSATMQNQVVTNGMSASRRNSPFANAGIVTEISPQDTKEFSHLGPLAGMGYQQHLESRMAVGGIHSQKAPAQRLVDFLAHRYSQSLPQSSYHPGLQSAPLHELLPAPMAKRLIDGFKTFGDKMKGFVSHEAVITAIESRTSSPVRIPRDTNNMNHPDLHNLYPCGEGAGYAGGIVSSAIDGENIAATILQKKNLL
jgi:uncharacterized FAD-dependent dehydrogenase